MDRRDFLADLSRTVAVCAIVPNSWRLTSRPRLADDPFTLGVASGDPLPDGGVLWTRLAPRPFEPDGGMDGQRLTVRWEVASDDSFRDIVARGSSIASFELGYSVHVDVRGLAPDRWYWYRFQVGEATSPVGRLRTAPPHDAFSPLALAFASCQHWEQGYFTAHAHLARETPDLVAFLGDYIYEYAGVDRVRRHHGLEIRTLDDYRRRYAQYKTDADLQAAHAACPWLVVWDDHEVDNNYADLTGENRMESVEQMRARRAAAYQAWYEHQPVRLPRAQSWTDLDITRRIRWGRTADFWMLDTRQYRSDQACDDGTKRVPCGDWADTSRTLLGARQEQWLLDGVAKGEARWQVLAQQVMMAPYDSVAGPDTAVSMDQWSGYPVARDRLLAGLAERAPNRTVVLTGDIHSNWVNELHAGFDRPDRARIGAEFVTTSISSGGDGSPALPESAQRAIAENPHVQWHNRQRGFVSCRVTPARWDAAYRVVPTVSARGSAVETPTRWVVENGKPGVMKA
jgi:alkaline phosphatase D